MSTRTKYQSNIPTPATSDKIVNDLYTLTGKKFPIIISFNPDGSVRSISFDNSWDAGQSVRDKNTGSWSQQPNMQSLTAQDITNIQNYITTNFPALVKI